MRPQRCIGAGGAASERVYQKTMICGHKQREQHTEIGRLSPRQAHAAPLAIFVVVDRATALGGNHRDSWPRSCCLPPRDRRPRRVQRRPSTAMHGVSLPDARRPGERQPGLGKLHTSAWSRRSEQQHSLHRLTSGDDVPRRGVACDVVLPEPALACGVALLRVAASGVALPAAAPVARARASCPNHPSHRPQSKKQSSHDQTPFMNSTSTRSATSTTRSEAAIRKAVCLDLRRGAFLLPPAIIS